MALVGLRSSDRNQKKTWRADAGKTLIETGKAVEVPLRDTAPTHSRIVIAVVGLVLATMLPSCTGGRIGLGERIRILYLGDTFSFSQNKIVLGWIEAEPRFTLSVVPCDLEVMTSIEAKKFTRLYLPRSYHDMNQSYDVLVLNNVSPRVIPGKILSFFSRGESVMTPSARISSASCFGEEGARARMISRLG